MKTTLAIAVVFVTGLRAAPVTGREIPRLIARWSFDLSQALKTPDSSGNGHHAELRAVAPGVAPAVVPGIAGNALRFRAQDKCDAKVMNRPKLNPSEALTVTAWVKHDGPITGTAEIVGKKGQAKAIVDGYRLFVSKAQRLCFEIGDGTKVYRINTPNRTIKPGIWYHVAGVFSPGRLRLFINTRCIADIAVAAQRIAPSQNHLTIGNFAGRHGAYPFNGWIDEAAIAAAALDADGVLILAEPHKIVR